MILAFDDTEIDLNIDDFIFYEHAGPKRILRIIKNKEYTMVYPINTGGSIIIECNDIYLRKLYHLSKEKKDDIEHFIRVTELERIKNKIDRING